MTAATLSPFLEPPGTATAACNHTQTSPEGYAASHTQPSCVLVQTTAGREAFVVLSDSTQEHVALHELWGLYFLLEMGFLNLPVIGLLAELCSLAGSRVPAPTMDPKVGSPSPQALQAESTAHRIQP